MGPLLKMPAGIFCVSAVLIMLFIFVVSRITGNKKGYGYYFKYGFFVGIMNTILFYISNNNNGEVSGGVFTEGSTPAPVMTHFPGIF
jgi:hypothetical protein